MSPYEVLEGLAGVETDNFVAALTETMNTVAPSLMVLIVVVYGLFWLMDLGIRWVAQR